MSVERAEEWPIQNLVFRSPDYGDCRVSHLFDIYGELTLNPEDAVKCVALMPDGKWLGSECFPDELVTGVLS